MFMDPFFRYLKGGATASAFSTGLLLMQSCTSLPLPDYDAIQAELNQTHPHLEQALTDLRLSGVPGERDAEANALQALLAEPLSPAAAQQIALLNSPVITSALAEFGIANAREMQASMLSNPGLFAGAMRPEGGGRWQLDLGVSQSLLDWLTRPMRMQLSREALLEAQWHLLQVLQVNLDNVLQDYYHALADLQRAEVVRINLDAALATDELARLMFEAGNISELERLQHAGELQRRQRQLWQTEAAALQSRLSLKQSLGLPANAQLLLVNALPELPEQNINFAAEILLESSLARRPEVRISEQRLLQSEQQLALSRRYSLLQQSEFSLHSEREFSGAENYGVGLGFGLPLFDQGQARRQLAESGIASAQAQQLLTVQQIDKQINQSLAAVNASYLQTRQLQDVEIPQYTQILALGLQEYNFMLLDTFSLLRLKQQQLEVQLAHVDSLAAYWLARSALAAATGETFMHPDVINGIPQTDSQPQEHQHHD